MHGHHTHGTYTDGDGRRRALVDGAIVTRPADRMTVAAIAVRDAVAGSTRAERPDLRMHLISAHASPGAAWMTQQELDEHHDHEHDGPGTIRSHSRDDRSWSRGKVVEVIDEVLAEP